MDIKYYCQGCSVLNQFPEMCDNCPNLSGNCHKYNSLMRNYKLLLSIANGDKIYNSVLKKVKNE